MTKKVENKKLSYEFEFVEELNQGMFEKFEAWLAKDPAEGKGIKTLYGKYLRAAIAVGWVVKPQLNNDQIAALDPRIIALAGDYLMTEYNKASIIPND